MYHWHAKVHKSGTKVAVFNGSKLVKIVESSNETFEPAEAQKFAEDLITTLKSRTSSQMTSPSDQPAVTDTNELHSDVTQAVTTQATGKGADSSNSEAAPVTESMGPEELDEGAVEPENDDNMDEDKFASETSGLKAVIANLKKKLAQERNDRQIERKARRGLAIAKQLVAENKLEDSYDAIKIKIAEIVKLEDSEIDRLERKVAGESEFSSLEEAQKELRRQSRIERINRQAAAEAQEDDDEDQAELLDQKADEAAAKVAHIEQVISLMKTANEAEDNVEEENKEEKADPAAVEAVPAVEPDPKEKDAASQVPPESEQSSTPAGKIEEEKADPVVPVTPEEKADAVIPEEKKPEDEKTAKLAELARTYRTVAANHRKLAEAAEVEGDIATADKEDALGDAAEEKAEDIEKKLAECKTAEPQEEPEAKIEEQADDAEQPAEPVEDESEKKEAARKQPGQTVSSSEHSTLKREGCESVDEFGIDKNASLVEQNDYSGDPEVEVLSKMWRGAPRDDQ